MEDAAKLGTLARQHIAAEPTPSREAAPAAKAKFGISREPTPASI